MSPVSNHIARKEAETRDPPAETRVGEPTHLYRRSTYPSAVAILHAMRRFFHPVGSGFTIVINQLGRLWKAVVVTGFKALFRHLSGGRGNS
jgi:hypothetical protein